MELNDQIRIIGMHPDDALKIIKDNLVAQGQALDAVLGGIADLVGASIYSQDAELDRVKRNISSKITRRINSQQKNLDSAVESLNVISDNRLAEQGAQLASFAVAHPTLQTDSQVTSPLYHFYTVTDIAAGSGLEKVIYSPPDLSSIAISGKEVAFAYGPSTLNDALAYFASAYPGVPVVSVDSLFDATPSEPTPSNPVEPIPLENPPPVTTETQCPLSPPSLVETSSGSYWTSYLMDGAHSELRAVTSEVNGANYYPDGPFKVYRGLENNAYICGLIIPQALSLESAIPWRLPYGGFELMVENLSWTDAVNQACSQCGFGGGVFVPPPPTEPPPPPPPPPPVSEPPDNECCDFPVDIEAFLTWRNSRHTNEYRERSARYANVLHLATAVRMVDLIGAREATERAIDSGIVRAGDGSILQFLGLETGDGIVWRERLRINQADDGTYTPNDEQSETPTSEPPEEELDGEGKGPPIIGGY